MWNAHRLRNFLGCLCWSTNISLVESSKSAKSSTSPLWLRPGRTARAPPPGHGKGKTASCSPTCHMWRLPVGFSPWPYCKLLSFLGRILGFKLTWQHMTRHSCEKKVATMRLGVGCPWCPTPTHGGHSLGEIVLGPSPPGWGPESPPRIVASTRPASRSGWGGWLRHQEALTASSNPFCGSPQSWVQRFNLACLDGWTWALAPATNGYSCAGRYLFQQRCRDLWFATKISPPISHCPFTGGVGCCSPIWIWILRWCRQVRYSISDAAACLLVAWHAACCSYIRYAILCDWEATQGTCDGSSAYASQKKSNSSIEEDWLADVRPAEIER